MEQIRPAYSQPKKKNYYYNKNALQKHESADLKPKDETLSLKFYKEIH